MAQEVIEGTDLDAFVAGTKPIPEPSEISPNGLPTEEITGPAITASPPE
jgi:hypothetical protein